MNNRIRVAITGAAGQIGYALLFRLASGQMFGPNTDIELNLLELEPALPALNGVAMELDDCAFPLLKRIVCTSDLKEAMDGVNWALLVGSVPRKQGMERSDLLKINGSIFINQGRAINDYASDDVRVFVVGNPCNTNCLIAKHHAKDVPDDRFYAMTTLDELRARTQLAQKAGVDVTAVSQMTIWGNHSSTQFPDFYNAKINGISAAKVIDDEQWLRETFVPTVQQRGAAVIKARGASSAASAANAIVVGVNHLVTDTVEGETFSMVCSSRGEYGVDEGLMFSFPCRREHGLVRRVGLEHGVVSVVEGLPFNEYSQAKFNDTLNELRSERDAVKELGLLD
ncbi:MULTISPECIES: malate dehydrogenase [Legionella]|uniref:Malate dehydrogenase n=1 Tax=Legionella septentrionalis TaxID=2498109 RepID=A0A3S0VP78_9GAMM|nr:MULTISPECIES: malate dehydrogenase [Legionella]MCP0914040.1 malate dehydrogenase [Legionella sp. 27cVA30]RUQ90799.1 malate dehydrogenase [Legionella septentrionalis]RUQ95031.1 malate dehydrogenase [Legionella septentrionalis]RUR09207.1 malate dehydrogenase [Legionella septentrionalis]RUR13932.1 malate dehydrogenase [Legionella septentrionalis]